MKEHTKQIPAVTFVIVSSFSVKSFGNSTFVCMLLRT